MLKKFVRRSLLGFILFVLVASGSAYVFYHYSLNQPINAHEYTVRSGMSLNRIARELAARRIISYPAAAALIVHARLNKQAHLLKAGDYRIPANINTRQLLTLMVAGKTVKYALTLVEGWNFNQIMAALHASPYLTHTLQDIDNKEIMAHLGVAEIHPEGRFYPDTYHFDKGMDDLSLLKTAYAKMEKELAAAWQQRRKDLPLKTPAEVLTLASIVEKETAVGEERPLIAGVFIQRLKRNMLLQTDPTVIYGLGDTYDGNIRKADLKKDTPYNTYTRKGLPPTPIAMPGRAALQAVVQPEQTQKLYFVAKGDGSHKFSDTLDEHNQAVIKYQLNGRKRAFSSMRKTEPE